MSARPTHPSIGLDGCPAGWIAARLIPGRALVFELHPSLSELAQDPVAAVAVDMPIGLENGARAEARECDRALRRLLGPRRASVFNPPTRPMLSAARYLSAELPGLSVQAFHLIPKIAELDRLLARPLRCPWVEAHPELAFAQLAGGPLSLNKHGAEGRALRRQLLARAAGPNLPGLNRALETALARWRRSQVKEDDLLDAAALSLVAHGVAAGSAQRWPEPAPRDRRGLLMAIHGLPPRPLSAEFERKHRILATVDAVPRGKLSTYGQIAELAGLPGRARLVARVLAGLPDQSPLPWWRIVSASGAIAPRAPAAMAEQARRLVAEGIGVSPGGRPDLPGHRWHP